MTQAVEELNQSRREYESHVQQAISTCAINSSPPKTASQMLKIYRERTDSPGQWRHFRAGLAAYQAGNQDFESLLSSFLDVLKFGRRVLEDAGGS